MYEKSGFIYLFILFLCPLQTNIYNYIIIIISHEVSGE